LLAGCSFDMSKVSEVVESAKPVSLVGAVITKTFLPSDNFRAEKLKFEKISFIGAEKAKITVVPSDETRVEATYHSNMEDHGFRVYYKEGEIEISVPKQTNFSAEKFEVTVYANLEKIEISGGIEFEMNAEKCRSIDLDIKGGAKVYVYNIDAANIEIDIAGAADIDLFGKTELFEIELAGAGSIDAKSLVSKKAEVKISGAGSAELSVIEELLADVDGVGNLTYYGDPVLKNISGGLTDVEQASKNVYGG
jgi:hypothetical protein